MNVWLLRGEPLTLVDTGPQSDEAVVALDEQLAQHGLTVEDIELVLLTHHHLDHTGLAGAIKKRSGARIAALGATADWGVGYHDQAAVERRFTERLLATHGVSDRLIAGTEPFWTQIVQTSADYPTDVVLTHGDEICAGGRLLRVVHRPGHSASDTLFVDEAAHEAFVGDHLLERITSAAEVTESELRGGGRRRGLLDYLTGLRQTAAMGLEACFSGHGPIIRNTEELIEERFEFHRKRLDRIVEIVDAGADTAFGISRKLWSDDIAASQTVLAIWEVLGHLDILVHRGALAEHVDSGGMHSFHVTETIEIAAAGN